MSLKNKIKEFESKIKECKNREEEAFDHKEKLIKLYQLGVIDSDGELIEFKIN